MREKVEEETKQVQELLDERQGLYAHYRGSIVTPYFTHHQQEREQQEETQSEENEES